MQRNLFVQRFGLISLIGLIALVVMALAPTHAYAFMRSGDTVVIGPDQVINDDLALSANHVVMNGTVNGDLFVSASTVEINGTVNGSAWAVGQTITLNGVVTHDTYIAGQVLTLGPRAHVTDDLMAAGASLENQRESVIGGNVSFAGSQGLLAGDVGKAVRFAGSRLELAGNIGGNVKAYIGQSNGGFAGTGTPAMPIVPSGLTVRDGTKIGGNLVYTTDTIANIPAGAVAGTVARYEPPVDQQQNVTSKSVATLILDNVRRFVALLLIGLLMIWLVPSWTQRLTGELEAKPFHSLGWGVVTIAALVLAFVVILVAMIALAVVLGIVTLTNLTGMVIVIGLLALFALVVASIILIAYVSQIIVSLLVGRLVLARLKPAWAEGALRPLIVGTLLLIIVTALPRIGGLIGLIAILAGLGSLWLVGRTRAQHRHIIPAAVPA